jgi:MarR family transcriptional regulator, organic hydroperoxide resistance regulator
MAMADLRRVFRDVGRVQAQLAGEVSDHLQRELGLPLVLFDAMSVIADAERCRVHDLAAGLGVSVGGASKLVDRLEALGNCRRLPNPGDRRSTLLELTLVGQERLAQGRQAVDEVLGHLFGTSLSEAQISELAGTLRDLRSSAAPSRLPPVASTDDPLLPPDRPPSSF